MFSIIANQDHVQALCDKGIPKKRFDPVGSFSPLGEILKQVNFT
jgi:hypothetical protein